jgi:hypothetical protein
MARLIRLLIGLVIFLVGAILLVRYGETVFFSLGGDHTEAAVVGACTQEKFLLVKRAPSCPARWGRHQGKVIGARFATGAVVPVRIVVGNAYIEPTDSTDLVLGYAAPIVMAVGFGTMVARRAKD